MNINNSKNNKNTKNTKKTKKNNVNRTVTRKSNKPDKFESWIREPWFTLIKENVKKVEARLYDSIFAVLIKGDEVEFKTRDKMNKEKIKTHKVIVKDVRKYKNFKELLQEEKFYVILPGVPNMGCALSLFNKIYPRQAEEEKGVVAIEFE